MDRAGPWKAADQDSARTRAQRKKQHRGQTEVFGLGLLIGMVAITAILVFVAGTTVVDDLQSSSELNHAERAMLSAEHELAQVAETGDSRSLSVTEVEGSREVTRAEGSLTVGWYGPSYDAQRLPAPGERWQNDETSRATEIDPLGAIELHHEEATYVYQAGAVWKETDRGTTVVSPPAIEHDNGTVAVDLRQLAPTDRNGPRTVATYNRSLADALAGLKRASAARHFGLVVESEYHEAWNRSLHRALDTSAAEIVHEGNTVRFLLRNASQPTRLALAEPPDVTVSGGSTTGPRGHRVPTSARRLTLTVPVRNEGDQRGTETVATTLPGTTARNVTLDPGQRTTVAFTTNVSRLTTGPTGAVTYDVRTGSGRSLLNHSGHIAVGPRNATVKRGTSWTTVKKAASHRMRTIGVNVSNNGISPRNVSATLELVYRGNNPTAAKQQTFSENARLQAGERTQLVWTLQASSLAEGRYEYAIDVAGTSRSITGTFSTPGGYGNTITAEGNVTIEILGTEASSLSGFADDGECQRWIRDCKKGWMPITASVLFNGTERQRLPVGSPQGGRFEYTEAAHNLNEPRDWGRTSTFETTIARPTPISLRATLYNCANSGLGSGYTDAKDVSGGPWNDRKCAAALDNPYYTANPFQDHNEGNLVVLRDGDRIKNLEQPGAGQRNVSAMLGPLVDNDTKRLDLDPNQAIFLGELTQPDADYGSVDPSNRGDPNFNDLVVRFKAERVTPTIRLRDIRIGRRAAGPGGPNQRTTNATGDTVDVQLGGQRLTVG